MTAYVNDEQKKEGAYGKAVKATLAATLAVGMVPAVAVAGEADDVAEANDVETLALTPQQAWDEGVYTATDSAGTAVALDKVWGSDTEYKTVNLTYTGSPCYLVLKTVDPEGVEGVVNLENKDLFEVTYYAQADAAGNPVKTSTIINAGSYSVKVAGKEGTAYAGIVKVFNFDIVNADSKLSNATVYQIDGNDATDVTDASVVYTGANIPFAVYSDWDDATTDGKLGLTLNGEVLKPGKDYDVAASKIYNAAGKEVAAGNKGVLDAGTYTLVVSGMKAYAGQTAEIKFTVEQFDLATAVYTFSGTGADDFVTNRTIAVEGLANGVAAAQLNTVCTARPSYSDLDAFGKYTYTVTPKNEKDTNFKNTGTAVDVNAQHEAHFFYNGVEKTGASWTAPVDLSKDQSFDLSKIAVCTDASGNNKLVAGKDYTVTATDAEGNKVEAITAAGEYTVKVVVDAEATEWNYKGEQTIKVVVSNGSIQGTNVTFAFDGATVNGTVPAITYDGTNALDRISTSVKVNGKELVQGEDYTLVVTKNGKVVDSIVDKGAYVVTLKSDKYDIPQDQVLNLSVTAAPVTMVRIAPESMAFEGEQGQKLVNTGEDIELKLQYAVMKDGKVVKWVDLPAEAFKASYKYSEKVKDGNLVEAKDAKALNAIGYYTFAIEDANAADNFTLNTGNDMSYYFDDNDDKTTDTNAGVSKVLSVVKGDVYTDVAKGDWYYQNVYDAKEAGYMYGIGNSQIFAPNQSTTRAMAATVLSRMAGAYSHEGMFTNPFTDIVYNGNDDDPWFTNSVLWANNAGIVQGYPGTTEFRPEAEVTRAEFCIMMQRYAAATGQGVDLAAGEADELLAAYPDADSVQPWCKDAIAWAVKNGIFGGGSVLNPDGNITRAEMAKMTTVFQAEPLKNNPLG